MTGPFGRVSPRTEPDGEPTGLALVLPGRAYSPSAPLLEFGRIVALQHGYAVRQVWWDSGSRPAGLDPAEWVARQAETALAEEASPPARVLVLGKSLGTYGATYAAEHGHDAIWLTPILVEPAVVAGIRANPARQLLVGGTADEFWDAGTATSLMREGCRVMEVPDADHALYAPGDAVRSAAIHAEVTHAMDAFLAEAGS